MTLFKKGQVPWNKGLKGTHFSSVTEFKKGHGKGRRVEYIKKICKECGLHFEVKPSLDRIKYCSHSCARKDQPSPMKGRKASKETREKQRQAKLGIVGPAHPLWKGGRDDRHDEMNREPYKIWRTTVFQRDNFTCQECYVMGVPLNAHHIKSWKNFPELRYNIDNGVTLCLPCHYKQHTKR